MPSSVDRQLLAARRAVLVAIVIGLTLLSGCSWGAAARPSAPPVSAAPRPSAGPETAATAGIQTMLDRLVQSIDDADRPAFDRLVSDRDPGFTPTAEMIFSNLTALRPSDLRITLTGRLADLTPARRQLLGDQASAVQAQVRWRLPGEQVASDQLLTVTVVPGSHEGYLLAGTTDTPATGAPPGERSGQPSSRQPLWWFEPVRFARKGTVSVITSQAVDPGPWLTRAERAARAVGAQRGTPVPAVGLMVPGSGSSAERVVGGRIDSQIGALTWADGSETAKAPSRIVINPPGVKDVGEAALDFLLAHETVHAATASPASSSPLWVIEGYADLIASRSYPEAQDEAAKKLLAQVRRQGAPAQLPDNDAFQGDSTQLAQAYAEAWFAFRYLVDTHSMATATRFYDELSSRYDGDLGRAMPAVLHQDPAEFTRGWRVDLERRAR